jgi:hypothetical protein
LSRRIRLGSNHATCGQELGVSQLNDCAIGCLEVAGPWMIPLVECSFRFFDVALGLEDEAASRVFSEVDEFMLHEELSTGRPFFFNT